MAEQHVCDFSHMKDFIPTEIYEFYTPVLGGTYYEKFFVKSTRLTCLLCRKVSLISKPAESTGQIVTGLSFMRLKEVN